MEKEYTNIDNFFFNEKFNLWEIEMDVSKDI